MRVIGPVSVKKKPVAPPLRRATVAPAPPPRAIISSPLPEPGTLGGVGAHTPDYTALLKSDPAYMAFQSNRAAGLATAAANRAAAIKALVTRFGGLPKGFTDAFGDVSQSDLTAAAGNQNSATALLKRQYAEEQAAMRKALAARGMLQSGDLGYGQGKLDQNQSTDEYNLGQQFLDALRGAVTDYTNAVSGYASQEPGVISDATSRVESLYPSTPGQDASYVAGSVEKYGIPVYQDANGKLWKPGVNGPEPFAPPTPAPQVQEVRNAVPAPVIAPRPVPVVRPASLRRYAP